MPLPTEPPTGGSPTDVEPPAGRRGARVEMPAEAEIVDIGVAGLDFVLLDLVHGPADESQLRRHVRLAHACGLSVLVVVEDPVLLARWARLGVDAAVMPTTRRVDPQSGLRIIDSDHLTVLDDPAGRSTTPWTAVDLAAVRRRALERVATAQPPSGGLPLVLLAGQLGDVSVWDDVVPALPPGGRYVALRIDLDDSIPAMAASVLAAAPARFALAGHSLGGIVALEISRLAPERVDRLALLNASGRGASEAQLAAWSALTDRLEDGDFDSVVGDLEVENLLPDHPDRERHGIRWRRMARTVGPDGLRRQLRAQATRPDSLPTLDRLRMPTLVVSGSADTVCRPELQAELVAGLPAARHVTLDGAGHMTPLTDAPAVAATLSRWLA